MSTVYFNYFMGQWLLYQVTAEQIQSLVPRRLTQQEADTIVNTPQPTQAVAETSGE
ncbi:hypothetical protein OMP38_14435 [Cohnella ginsengisoli]|uniref:XkdX family protein n=1 Tax=Cohnella ginsengisoli TaxID=425004 RepID=A0A9X4QMF4_9BACL|nr:hypothetical protein [Cohnella ginsengisoli]MDG0791914.1 hypothetical protein [Cohnella ginsengisoli]